MWFGRKKVKSKTLKYVIIKDKSSREKAILFDPELVHSDVFNKSSIVSAGFCILVFNDLFLNVKIHGESASLQIKSRPDDRNLIYMSLMSGPWDYHLSPDDPLYETVKELMEKMNEKN